MAYEARDGISSNRSSERIALYALLSSVTAVSIDIVLPAYQAIATEFAPATVTDLQNNILLFICGMFFGELLAGFFADSHGRKKTLLASVVIYLIGTLICIFAADFFGLLLGRLLQGAGAGGQKICTRAIIRDVFSGAAMARVMSLVMLSLVALPFVAPYFGAAILEQFGWRAIFIFLAIFAMVSVTWFWWRQPETWSPQRQNHTGLVSTYRLFKFFIGYPRTVGYTLAAGILFGVHLAFLSLAPIVFLDLYQISRAFPFYFGCLGAAFGVALLINARAVTRFGMTAVVSFGLWLLIFAVTYIALCIVFYEQQPPFFVFFSYLFLTLLSLGLIFGNLNALIMEPLRSAAGLGNAFASALSTLVALPVSYAVGFIYQQTLPSFVLPLGMCCIAGGVACLYARRGKTRDFVVNKEKDENKKGG